MDLIRRVSSDVPPARLFSQDKPSLLICWWCTLYTIVVILFRIVGRYVRTEQMFLDDGIMLSSIIPLLGRMGSLHVVLLFGTNNAIAEGLSTKDIHRREIGSGLVLCVRFMEALYLWAIKFSTLIFLQNLIQQTKPRFHQAIILISQVILGGTLLGVIISIIAECRPTTHYWQVTPDAGPACRQAPAQYFTFASAHILSNICLVIIPFPIILKVRIPTTRKLAILLLVSLPLLNVAYTVGSSPYIARKQFLAHTRALFGSLDILLNAFWSNAIVLCALLQDKGIKKPKYQHKLGSDQKGRSQFANANVRAKPKTREREPWDSDEELIVGGDQRGTSSRSQDKTIARSVANGISTNGEIELTQLPPTNDSRSMERV